MASRYLIVDGNRHHGGPDPEIVIVPPDKAKCPECGGSLLLQVNAWDSLTGCPEDGGVDIDCEHEPDCDDPDYEDRAHRWWQSDWQRIVDYCRAWAHSHVRVRES